MNTLRREAPAIGGLAISIAAHVLVGLYVSQNATVPDLGIEFELPSDVEFGLTDEVTTTPQQAQAAAEMPPVTEASPTDDGIAVDAGVPRDAGRDGGRDAGREDLVASAQEGTDDTTTDGEPGAEDDATLPAGAQIALRIDMASVRTSTLAPDVRAFLDSVPDWQLILRGSGIQPVDDLDRVLIASPDMSRERAVIAGRYTGDTTFARAAVERMHQARGSTVRWRDVRGIPVADWPNEDSTARVIALVGPHHFTISRPEDLDAILAQARIAAQEGESDADALLAMGEGVALSLTVEGARRYMRGGNVPERLELTVRERELGGGVAIHAVGRYETPAAADEAVAFWTQAKEQFGRNLLMRLAGMSQPIENAELRAQGRMVEADTEMNAQQLRVTLSFMRGQLEAFARQRGDLPRRPSTPAPAPSTP